VVSPEKLAGLERAAPAIGQLLDRINRISGLAFGTDRLRLKAKATSILHDPVKPV
jgi:hypothetical protein